MAMGQKQRHQLVEILCARLEQSADVRWKMESELTEGEVDEDGWLHRRPTGCTRLEVLFAHPDMRESEWWHREESRIEAEHAPLFRVLAGNDEYAFAGTDTLEVSVDQVGALLVKRHGFVIATFAPGQWSGAYREDEDAA